LPEPSTPPALDRYRADDFPDGMLIERNGMLAQLLASQPNVEENIKLFQ
jgi:hypothetical protein